MTLAHRPNDVVGAAADGLSPLGVPERRPESPNMHWVESWRARVATARGNAELKVGVDWVRMAIHGCPASSTGALRTNAYLPSNLRYAGPRHRASLVADGWPEPKTLESSIQEFRVGVRSARPRTRSWTPTTVDASPSDTALIEGLDAADRGVDVVAQPTGWELGVQIRGRRVPVRVAPERDGLRLQRLVLKSSGWRPGSSIEASVCDAALRLNGRIRFARFALHQRGLTVEARLPHTLLDQRTLVESAHAVAVVGLELGPQLELLSRHPEVARCYNRIFHPQNKEHAA